MTDRLQELLQREGLTAAKFASVLGVQPSAISHLLSGRNKPGYDFICRFMMAFPRYNIEWLLLGKQPILKDEQPTSPAIAAVDKAKQEAEPAQPQPTVHKHEPEAPTLFTNEADNVMPIQTIDKSSNCVADNKGKAFEKQQESYPQPKQIVILYDDSTFKAYDPR